MQWMDHTTLPSRGLRVNAFRMTVGVNSGKVQTEQKISASSQEQSFAAVFGPWRE